MRRALNVLIFLLFVAEPDGMFFGKMATPVSLLSFLTDKTPIKLTIFEVIVLVAIAIAGSGARSNRARPMDRAIQGSLATIGVWWVYGIVTGGDGKATYNQLHSWVSGLALAWALISYNRTVSDFVALGKAVYYAAMYRAALAILFYVAVVRGTDFTPPLMTTHGDTVLFVVGLLLVISYAIEVRTRRAFTILALSAPLILVAIQLNNRRLAWASLGGSLPILYALLPASKVKRRIRRSLLMVAPVILLYVAVGWGRPEKIFKPLAAFSTMGAGKVDASTQARENENWGMMTMVNDNPVIGTGWGHEWREIDSTYTVHVEVFPMYHYQPHNTVASILAFCGFLGFAGTWMVFPVLIYLNARSYRVSQDPLVRVACAVGIAQVVVCTNQMFGDMGFAEPVVATVMAIGAAVAGRLSVLSGAWPGARGRAMAAAPSPPPQALAAAPAERGT